MKEGGKEGVRRVTRGKRGDAKGETEAGEEVRKIYERKRVTG